MALNFQQLQNRGGGGQNSVGSLLSSVAAGMPSAGENVQLDVQLKMMENLKPLQNLSTKDLDGMMGDNESFKVQDAFAVWNDLSLGWTKREKLAAQRAGINPLSFKESYDKQKLALVDTIGRNVLAYQDMNKFSDNEIRAKFGDMNNIAKYISANSTDAAITSLVSPKRNAWDQLSDFGAMLMPGKDDTIGELAMTAPGLALQGLGGRALYNRYLGGGAASGGTTPAGASRWSGFSQGNPSERKTIMQKAKNLFSKGKSPSAKSISSFITKNLGKARGMSMLARLGPYGALAALIGGAGYALYKNRDTYQDSQDARMEATYGGGPVDTSGAAGIEEARRIMADYNAKYGR